MRVFLTILFYLLLTFFLKRKSVVLYDEREMRVQKQSTLFSGKTYFGFLHHLRERLS